MLYDDFPSWVSVSERKLLHASMGEIEVSDVVAKDGSGTHKTIGEALKASMECGGRTIIHVQAGTYHECIKIPTKQKNIMLVGDGKGKTVIVGEGVGQLSNLPLLVRFLSLLLVNYMIAITVKGLACVNCIIWMRH